MYNNLEVHFSYVSYELLDGEGCILDRNTVNLHNLYFSRAVSEGALMSTDVEAGGFESALLKKNSCPRLFFKLPKKQ